MVSTSSMPTVLLAVSQRDQADWAQKEQPGIESAGAVPAAGCGGLEVMAGPLKDAKPTKSAMPAMKEVLRLQHELREITKIEERVAASLSVNHLQTALLAKSHEIAAQLQRAQEALAAEQALAEQEQQLLQTAAGKEQAASQMAPAPVYHMPMMMCEALNLQQQQQACTRPPYAFQAANELHFGQAWEAPAEAAKQEERPGMSSSARRRMRRQRAQRRRPEAPEPQSAAPPGLDLDSTTESLEAGGERRVAGLANLRGSVVNLAFDREGCRTVQTAIQVADHAAAVELVAELHGHVRDALASPHANYVLQTVITALPTAMSGFVVKEIIGAAAESARHRFGCRILCRLVEHSSANADLAVLLREILDEAILLNLCRHTYAHYVMQSILEHLPEHGSRITDALRSDLVNNALHRCASHVVEAVLLHSPEQDQQRLVQELLGPGCKGVVPLAQSQFGSFVLKAILRSPGRLSEEARDHLLQAVPVVEKSKYGLRLLKDLRLIPVPDA